MINFLFVLSAHYNMKKLRVFMWTDEFIFQLNMVCIPFITTVTVKALEFVFAGNFPIRPDILFLFNVLAQSCYLETHTGTFTRGINSSLWSENPHPCDAHPKGKILYEMLGMGAKWFLDVSYKHFSIFCSPKI